jgi:tripartite-type tricarboxylate transporter receptor subunit TctC
VAPEALVCLRAFFLLGSHSEKPEEIMAKMPILMLAIAALFALGQPARTQQRSWPVRPVKLVVSTPPGSGQDLIARNLTEPLQKRLGQPFIVENIPGAGSVRSADVS